MLGKKDWHTNKKEMKISELYNQVLNEATDNVFYHGSPHVFDKFDFSKIGTGDGLNKYGYGLYFADREGTAMYYAKELSIGHFRSTGFNLYIVKLLGLDQFYEWEEEIPLEVQDCVIYKLKKMGNEDDANQVTQEYEEYGQAWSLRNMYEYLTHILGSTKNVSEFLNICGVNGVIAQSPAHSGNIYVAYADDVIKILDIKNIK